MVLFVSDIDECGLIDVIYCDDPLELCINTLGSFHCECQEGFHWGSNGCEGLCGYESKVELHQEINRSLFKLSFENYLLS